MNSFNRTKAVGRKCHVKVQVGDREFSKLAVTQPGDDIFWTVSLSIDFSDLEDMKFLMEQKKDIEEEDLSYMPPRREEFSSWLWW